MEYYFETDDKLERRKYAEFLKSMLENCDKYRREDSDGAYVIAIDSPWGTGKTRFAKMLRNYLEGRKPKLSAGKVNHAVIPKPDSKREFNVIYYNSWEVDYWTDAIEPLISNIINSDVFKEFREDEQNKELWNQFKNFAKGVLEASIDVAAEFSMWGKILNILVRGVKKTRERVNKPFEEFDKRKKLYSGFAESLSEIISKTGRKLVIIVDELDRCRPTFAIQTLELAKHLFVVKGLSFIFALDINQLGHSVQTVYGLGMDAPGYLCRFFDYLSKMPQPSIGKFIDDLLGDLRPNQQFYPDNGFKSMLIANIWGLAIMHSLSLRDVATLIVSYRILFKVCLADYPDISAHQLYLYLLVLKYKNGLNYEQLLLGKLAIVTIKENFSESITIKYGENQTNQSRRLELLGTNKSIENLVYSTYNCINGEKMEGRLFGNFFTLGNIKNPDLKYFIRTEHSQQSSGYDFQDTENLEQVLYYEDLKKWETIKSLTLGQYYFQQLEMFNFALPADNSESEA